jgi:hypothetical protein
MTDEERLRDRLQRAIGYEPPSSAFSAQPISNLVAAGLPDRHGAQRRSPWIALAAALIAVAVVATLLFAARSLHLTSPLKTIPSTHGVVDGLHCKLPVYTSGVKKSGGFISFPAGTFASDDSSNVVTPAGGAWFGLTYDAAVKRWLPVPATWVSPDGGVYFFAEPRSGNNTMFEVNAQSGASAELGIAPLGYGWQVVAVTSDYVFAKLLMSHAGVYIMPIASPYTQERYIPDGFWTAGYGNYAFGTTVPGGGAIERIDARKQTMETPPVGAEPWFNKSSSAEILGFDGSGNPVIWTGTDLWIATGPNQATRISSSPPIAIPKSQASPIDGADAPVADAHGLWFSTTDGIYLYADGQTTKVSSLVAQVAGPCIAGT